MIPLCVPVMLSSLYGILVVSSLDSGSKSPGARPGWVIVWYSRERHYSLDRLGLGFLPGGVEVFSVTLCYTKPDMLR